MNEIAGPDLITLKRRVLERRSPVAAVMGRRVARAVGSATSIAELGKATFALVGTKYEEGVYLARQRDYSKAVREIEGPRGEVYPVTRDKAAGYLAWFAAGGRQSSALGDALSQLKRFFVGASDSFVRSQWLLDEGEESHLRDVVIPNLQRSYPVVRSFARELTAHELVPALEVLRGDDGLLPLLVSSVMTLMYQTTLRPFAILGETDGRCLNLEDLELRGRRPNRVLRVVAVLPKPRKGILDERLDSVYVKECEGELDAIRPLLAYLAATGRSLGRNTGPLFVTPPPSRRAGRGWRCTEDFLPCLRQTLRRAGVDHPERFNSRSFRSGGGIDRLVEGASREDVRRHGGWSAGSPIQRLYHQRPGAIMRQLAAKGDASMLLER